MGKSYDGPEHQICSLAELIEWVRNAPGIIWYRGQRRAEWSVLPFVFRDPPAGNERDLTNRFRSRAAIRRQINPGPNDYASWLSIMQHYGLPTRLLDWSRSPLIAAYFAVGAYKDRKIDLADAAIWILSPHQLNNIEISSDFTHPIDSESSQKLLKPAFKRSGIESGNVIAVMGIEHDLRIFAQQGAFTIHSDRNPMEVRTRHEDYLMKLTIPLQCVIRMAEELYACGIRRGDIFPDLTNLADEMKGIA